MCRLYEKKGKEENETKIQIILDQGNTKSEWCRMGISWFSLFKFKLFLFLAFFFFFFFFYLMLFLAKEDDVRTRVPVSEKE